MTVAKYTIRFKNKTSFYFIIIIITIEIVLEIDNKMTVVAVLFIN